jgi:hypothetical protein
MGAAEDFARLLKEAAASMKGDIAGAIGKLNAAYALAEQVGDAQDVASVAEELARAWARRKSTAKSMYYAIKTNAGCKSWPAMLHAWPPHRPPKEAHEYGRFTDFEGGFLAALCSCTTAAGGGLRGRKQTPRGGQGPGGAAVGAGQARSRGFGIGHGLRAPRAQL